jgi:hypothetical protein
MTRPAPIRQADITRAIKGAENAGWPARSFKVVVEGHAITLLPIAGAASEADDLARRIEGAFGDDQRAAPLRP